MKKLLLSLGAIASINAFAIVPTTDVSVVAQDTTTQSAYIAQIPGYISQMNSAANAAQQVAGLKGLSQVQGAGGAICNLCNANDQASMQAYLNNINTDLCSQFSNALTNITGAQQSITSLQGIMATFATNPKAAALALQQAMVATQSVTNNTMAQMQMLQAQTIQKQLATEKMQQTQSTSFATGFKSGN